MLGCNYWASHAGTGMWRDWRPEQVDQDLTRLAAHGARLLRVFPLWPDFQPLRRLYSQGGLPGEFRLGDAPLSSENRDGVDPQMIRHLRTLCDLAAKHDQRLIIGLVTGWMSGRLFMPPALEGRDPITDPTCLRWQMRLVRRLVTELRDHPAIECWDLGNECNCMGDAPDSHSAYLWTSSISQTIRVADPSRPIISGMHSLTSEIGRPPSSPPYGTPNAWFIEDQGELTDILTTHPYPYWSRYTRADPVTDLRVTLHATAETRLYADLSGRPCFAEEIGTMGPMVAGDRVSADFARVNLFSLWANDCRALLWWCAHDQDKLRHPPYERNAVEVELGLLRSDGSAKPVLQEIARFDSFLRSLPFHTLPPRLLDAVCILSHDQDDWAVAYGAFVLGKQAGLEISFRSATQTIPSAPVYLLPSVRGAGAVSHERWRELLGRCADGAALYVSLADGILPGFNEAAGVELVTRSSARTALEAEFVADGVRLPLLGGLDLRFVANDAEIIARRPDYGSPVFWRKPHGRGHLYVFAAPLEEAVTLEPGAFSTEAPPYARVYAEVAKRHRTSRWLSYDHPRLAVTEHTLLEKRVVIVINHDSSPHTLDASLADGTRLLSCLHGHGSQTSRGCVKLDIPPYDACVLILDRPDR